MQGNTPGIRGQSDRADDGCGGRGDVAQSGPQLSAKLASMDAAAILKDHELSELALSLGESAFGDNCATCHGAGGRGAKGYPRLADDVWLWGGSLTQIEYTIRHGVRSGASGARELDMPAFGRDEFLTPAPDFRSRRIRDGAFRARSRSRPRSSAPRPVFVKELRRAATARTRVAAKQEGAPNLTDADWLYGGDRATHSCARSTALATASCRRGRQRLDPATVRALAVYVHSLGGGQ